MKVKVKIVDLLVLANLSHPDFGVFAKFLDGLKAKIVDEKQNYLIVDGEEEK